MKTYLKSLFRSNTWTTRSWAAINLFFFLLPGLAMAQSPSYSVGKNICLGTPTAATNANLCPLAPLVNVNAPVYYTITVTNPPGEPPLMLDLLDTYPGNFQANGGGIFCEYPDTGTMTTLYPSGSGSVGKINLPSNATITCYIPGKFTSVGPASNTVSVKTDKGQAVNDTVNTTVLSPLPLPTDLKLDKTVDQASIDVSSGAMTLTYTITLKNNGLSDATIAQYFKLHDQLSLPVNGVPLNVSLISATCTASSVNSDCPNNSGFQQVGSNPVFVPTSAPKPFFNWSYDSTQPGVIKAGETLTFTIVVKVEQLAAIACIAALDANGLRNTAFFTLNNQTLGIALNDQILSNNTASVQTKVETGITQIEEGCGKGHLFISKKIYKPLPGLQPWGSQVTYDITIKNLAVPAQPITISAAQLRDLVTEGINTPPFKRVHIASTCMGSLCPTTSPISPDPTASHTYYGDTIRAWASNADITLPNPNDTVTIRTILEYRDPDCETVPLAPSRPIINTAVVTYQASPYGGSLTDPLVTFTQNASATVNMEKQPACQFVVRKKVENHKTNLEFGNAYGYDITFTNNEPKRTIGTLLEAIRIQSHGYSTGLPFTAKWTCSASGGSVTGFNSPGTQSGVAIYTTTPAMGAQLINLGTNVMFDQGATLSCHIDVLVSRPAFNAPLCTQAPHFIENLALMDVTNPFNNNIAWPTSGVYNTANAINPNPQDKNWATVTKPLPKCWDAVVNKSAKVDGLPASSAPWTYVGGPAINYNISVTNPTSSALISNLPNPRWWLEDTISPLPYSSGLLQMGSPLCTGFICDSAPTYYNGTTLLGIANLASLSTGLWKLTYPGPFAQGRSVVNCVSLQSDTGSDFYSNSDPAIAKKDCVTVPVIALTSVTVTKLIIDKTGANQSTGGNYQFNLNCSPYAVPIANASFGLPTNIGGMSHTVNMVPVLSTCAVVETQVIPPAATAQACGGASNVLTSTNITTLPNPLNPNNNQVTVTNTFSCKNGFVRVIKNVVAPHSTAANLLPAQSFTVTANCNPTATPLSSAIMAGAQTAGSALFTAPLGANCLIGELSPSVTPEMEKYCAAQGLGAPYWLMPAITPANVVASIPAAQVTIQNSWNCSKPVDTSTVVVEKKLTYPPNFPPITFNFNFTLACKYLANSIPFNITTDGSVNNVSNAITLLTGAQCIVKEVLPPFPVSYEQKVCPNGTLSWAQPIYNPSQPMILGPGQNTVVVTNEMICTPKGKGNVTIEKSYKGPQLPLNALTSVPFTLTMTCSNPNYSHTQTVTIGSSVNFTPPVGAMCTVTETFPSTPPAGICPSGKVFQQWNPPSFNPVMPFQVSNVPQTFKLVNTWECVPYHVTVVKSVTGNGLAAAVPALPYTFSLQCPGVPISQMTLTTNGLSNNTGIMTTGAWNNCSLTESLPTLTSALNLQLCPNGNLSWAPPVYSPPEPYNLNTLNQPITVRNELVCTPKNIGSVSLIKSVIPPLGVQVAPINYANLQFGVQANCTPSITAGVNAGFLQNGSSLNFTPPVGATCSFTESFPTVNQNNLCPGKIFDGWETPVFTPALPLTVGAGSQIVKVTNQWKCKDFPSTKITLTKVISGAPAGYVGSYPITVNGSLNTLNITGNGTASTSLTLALPGPVVYSESLPNNLPSNCMWETPVYSPASGTAPTNGQVFTVTNQMKCFTGKVTLNKVLQPFPGVQLSPTLLSGLSFGINANCSNPNFVASGTINPNGTYSISPPAGAICTFTETFPTLTPTQQKQLCPQGTEFDGWNAPNYVPTNPLTIIPPFTPMGQQVQLNNSYKCKVIPQPIDVKLSKLVIGAPAGYAGQYSITANTQNYALALQGNGTITSTQSISVPAGSAFTYSENALPPAAPNCTWATPTYSPPSGTIPTTSGQVFTVTNRMNCAPVQPVVKMVQGAPSNYQGSYAITINGQTINLNQLGNGTQNGSLNIATGAVLNMSEVSSPPPQGCTWAAPVFVPPNGSINPGPAVAIQVINRLSCTTNFTVKKEVTGNTQGANLSFPIVVNGQSISLSAGQSSQPFTIPSGQAVTYAEGALPTPPTGCTWAAPTYNPPSGTIPTNGQVFTVTNALNCVPPKVNISLSKEVIGAPANYQATYPITVNGGLNNLSVTGSNTSTVPLTVLANQAVNYVETSLPAPPAGCTWAPVTYSPASGVLATAGMTIKVTNRLNCATVPVTVSKQIVIGGPVIMTVPGAFQFTANGVPGSVNASSSVTLQFAPGTSVQVVENTNALPPVPSGFAGCTWGAPIYSPANGTVVAGTQSGVVIYNPIICNDTLTIKKVILGLPQGYSGSMNFPFTVSNNSNSNLASGNIVTSGSQGQATVSLVSPQVIKVTEGALPPPPPGCTWAAPSYSSSNGVMSFDSANKTMTITNTLNCAPAATFPLTIIKTVEFVPNGLSYAGVYGFSVNGASVGNITISGNGSAQKLLQMNAAGAVTVQENALPTVGLPAGCSWLAPVYIPSNGVVTVGLGLNPTVNVVNRMSCVGTTTGSGTGPGPSPGTGGYGGGQWAFTNVPFTKYVFGAPTNYAANFTINTSLGGSFNIPIAPGQVASTVNQSFVSSMSTMTFSEPNLPPAAQRCIWLTPTYFPSAGSAGTINSMATGNPAIVNRMYCPPTVTTPLNGTCGTAFLGQFATAPTQPPAGNLCAAPHNNASIAVSSTSTGYTWTCPGVNGGGAVSCKANR